MAKPVELPWVALVARATGVLRGEAVFVGVILVSEMQVCARFL